MLLPAMYQRTGWRSGMAGDDYRGLPFAILLYLETQQLDHWPPRTRRISQNSSVWGSWINTTPRNLGGIFICVQPCKLLWKIRPRQMHKHLRGFVRVFGYTYYRTRKLKLENRKCLQTTLLRQAEDSPTRRSFEGLPLAIMR